MALDLGTPETGCLLLADISGYTDYIGSTELLHAQDVIADLLETIVGVIEPTFQLSKLEGDAAFAYASINSINPTMMLDTVEAAYFAFQKRLRDITHATSCPCDACVMIPKLDLKFFVHDGQYVIRRIARSEELTGHDVILVHRLAKGTAADKIGKPAYAVFTKSTLDTMGMDPTVLGFVPHTESFDDVGDVEVFIQDLALRWTFEQERNRDVVTSSDAVYEASFETPAAPSVVWEYLTNPQKRYEWQTHVTELIPQTEGRVGAGTVNHCMHGPDSVTVEHVSDWRPFDYLTLRYDTAGLVDWAWTQQVETVEDGTRFTMRISNPGDEDWAELGDAFTENVDSQIQNLQNILATQG